MPIPDRGFFDPRPEDAMSRRKQESHRRREEDAARVKAQHEEKEQQIAEQKTRYEEHQRKAREEEAAKLTERVSLIKDTDTREMLLERIRKMREDKVNVMPESVGYRTPLQEEQLKAEQEAGRAATAKYEAEAERNRQIAARLEAEEQAAKESKE